MRAAAAEMLWESNPQGAHESIGIVHRAIGSALTELDHLIPSLEAALGNPEEPNGASEQLDDVEALVQRMRDAGVAVEADLDPTRDVPPAVAMAAYRVVQEALANCARHAPGARVRVRVSRVTDDLVVEVADDGPGLRGARPGYGQVGMRERVGALGGTVSLQPGDGGVGLLVRATVPMQSAEAVAW
jgi:signal transduction histidine kinase